MNELDQILRQEALQQSSANKIQNAVRNRNARNETIKRKDKKAATKIQNAVRNRNARNETIERMDTKAVNKINQIEQRANRIDKAATITHNNDQCLFIELMKP